MRKTCDTRCLSLFSDSLQNGLQDSRTRDVLAIPSVGITVQHMRDFIESHPSMSPCTFEPLQENKTNCIRIAAFTLNTFVCTFGIGLRSVSFKLNS